MLLFFVFLLNLVQIDSYSTTATVFLLNLIKFFLAMLLFFIFLLNLVQIDSYLGIFLGGKGNSTPATVT